MARNENPPFERGKTWFDGATIATADVTATANLEGKEWEFEDVNVVLTTVGAKTLRSGRTVRCRIVRNVAAAALLPKRLVTFKAGTLGSQVDGYATVTAGGKCYPVDEWLPAAGAPVNDLFWIVVKGPATVLTDLAGGANNVINQDDRLVSLTGATSGATTSGRVATASFAVTQTALADAIMHTVGKAMSSLTTGNTNADCLVDVGLF